MYCISIYLSIYLLYIHLYIYVLYIHPSIYLLNDCIVTRLFHSSLFAHFCYFGKYMGIWEISSLSGNRNLMLRGGSFNIGLSVHSSVRSSNSPFIPLFQDKTSLKEGKTHTTFFYCLATKALNFPPPSSRPLGSCNFPPNSKMIKQICI